MPEELPPDIAEPVTSPYDLKPLSKEYLDTNINERTIFSQILHIIEDNKDEHSVLVIGDVMLDYYMYCTKTALLQSQRHNVTEDYSFSGLCNPEKRKLGGAAHIANACQAFSQVTLFGVIGEDSQGVDLEREANEVNINTKLHKIKKLLTTTKMYIECELSESEANQHPKLKYQKIPKKIIRINREFIESEGKERILRDEESLISEFSELINNVNCIIFKDHQKGFLSDEYLSSIIPIINSKNRNCKPDEFLVFIDPKYQWNKFNALRKVDAILPNVKEAAAGAYPGDEKRIAQRDDDSSLQKDDWIALADRYHHINCFVVTMDEKGASLYRREQGSEILSVLPKLESDPLSEIGCGDVFDAYYIACVINKNQILKSLPNLNESDIYSIALRLANYAAGIKMCDTGSEIISPQVIIKSLGLITN